MNRNLEKYIIDLLKEHECVVLPSIGGLLLKYIPAHISNNTVFPSNKIIHFNKNILNEDDLLLSEIMKKEGLSYLDAKNKVLKFSSTIKFELAQKGFFDIDGLGRMIILENDNIKFINDSNILNLDKDNFGFRNINVFPVQRVIIEDRKANIIEVETLELGSKNKSNKKININQTSNFVLVATLLLIFGIFSLMFSNTSIESLKVKNASVLNILVPKKNEFKKHYGQVIAFDKYLQENKKKKKKKKIKGKKSKDNKNVIIIEDIEDDSNNNIIEEDIKIKVEQSKSSTDNSDLNNFTEDLTKEEKEPKSEKLTSTETTIYSNLIIKDVLKVRNEDNPLGYYVIIGAFGSLTNANKAKYECSIDNTCKVFKAKSGMYRVGIYTDKDPEIAIDILDYYKKTNSSYWLLLNE